MITNNEQLSNATTDELQFRGETGRVRFQPNVEETVVPMTEENRPLGSELFYHIADQQTKEWQRPSLNTTPLTTGYALEGEAHLERANADAMNDDEDLYRLEDNSWSQAS